MTASYVIAFYYSIGICFQFAFATCATSDRIRIVNERISSKHLLNSFDVQNFIEMYRKLFKISIKINKTLTVQLVAIFTFLFITITFEFYSVVRMLFRDSSLVLSVKLLVCLNATLWTLAFIYPLFAVIKASEMAIEEIDKIKDIGYDILCRQKIFDYDSEKTFDIFMRSIERQKLQPQTLFFNLDWNLFFKVTNSLTKN